VSRSVSDQLSVVAISAPGRSTTTTTHPSVDRRRCLRRFGNVTSPVLLDVRSRRAGHQCPLARTVRINNDQPSSTARTTRRVAFVDAA
jgi:hypothetical protein